MSGNKGISEHCRISPDISLIIGPSAYRKCGGLGRDNNLNADHRLSSAANMRIRDSKSSAYEWWEQILERPLNAWQPHFSVPYPIPNLHSPTSPPPQPPPPTTLITPFHPSIQFLLRFDLSSVKPQSVCLQLRCGSSPPSATSSPSKLSTPASPSGPNAPPLRRGTVPPPRSPLPPAALNAVPTPTRVVRANE